jgi:hypothetical protein
MVLIYYLISQLNLNLIEINRTERSMNLFVIQCRLSYFKRVCYLWILKRNIYLNTSFYIFQMNTWYRSSQNPSTVLTDNRK